MTTDEMQTKLAQLCLKAYRDGGRDALLGMAEALDDIGRPDTASIVRDMVPIFLGAVPPGREQPLQTPDGE
jgi:hypothetical protein